MLGYSAMDSSPPSPAPDPLKCSLLGVELIVMITVAAIGGNFGGKLSTRLGRDGAANVQGSRTDRPRIEP